MADSLALPILLCVLAMLGELAWLGGAFFFVRGFRPSSGRAEGAVTLILAGTGRTKGLPPLFAALGRQTLRPRRLILAVESESDPIVAQARELSGALPCPLVIAVGGNEAERRSQKATNLIAGLAMVDGTDQAIVLFDADILPRDGWLMDLAAPALLGDADVVHGGRWSLVAPNAGPLRHFAAFLDRTLTLSPRQVMGRGYVWGGSIAIAAPVLRRMELADALDRALSTDGAIDRRIGALGLRLLFRRVLLVPTPDEGGDRGAWAFKRRQMQMIHLNHPPAWRLLGLALHLQGASLVLAVLALAGNMAAAWLLLLPMAMGLARAAAHDCAGRTTGRPDAGIARWIQHAIGAATPIATAFALIMFWSTARVRRVRWRHVDYLLGPDGAVRVTRRRQYGTIA